jgi:hypothetical protein
MGAGVVIAGSASGCAETSSAVGTTSLTSGIVDACRGDAFNADMPDPGCVHRGVGVSGPAPDGLRIAFAGPLLAHSGGDAGIIVEMTNTTNQPLAVEVDDSCGTFEGQAWSSKASSFHSECFGVCGKSPEPRVLRVTLEPGGVIRKSVKFSAVQTHTAPDSQGECIARAAGILPAGEYALRVNLPWADPVADDPGVMRPRVLEGQLTVTP